MRRAASILSLTVAALASIATKMAPPGVSFRLDPVVVWIDRADPEPLVVRLEASLDEDARRRAEITNGQLGLTAYVPEGPLPEDVELVVTGSDGTWAYAEVDATCTTEDCEASLEIRVEAPPDAPPFPVQIEGNAFVGVSDPEDAADVAGALTLSGAVPVVSASIPYDSSLITVDPTAPPRFVARLEASLGSAPPETRLRGASVEVSVSSLVPEPYAVKVRMSDGGDPVEWPVTERVTNPFRFACTGDPCVATVEITFDAPADNGPFDVWIGGSAVVWADAAADPGDVAATLTIAEAP